MTKKDYTKIADILHSRVLEAQKLPKNREQEVRLALLLQIADDLSIVFLRDNPRFRREVFMEACGL